MKITPDLFEAYLKCPIKCWLRAAGEAVTGNTYAEWVKMQDESYRSNETARLSGELSNGEITSPEAENLKSAKWLLATNVTVQAKVNSCAVESNIAALERIASEGRGKAAQFVPISFIFRNKLTNDDKLLPAFDAFVLSETLGRQVSFGKIIHGADHAALKVKTAALAGEVRTRLDKIASLLANPTPPELVLNRHCPECEFRDRCRQKAIETNDLSLLAGMSAKERQKLRSKGIFTVTQLSYTFRPRRRPRRMRDKREKYHHALKALAIREKKIHIVGSPELKIEGTPVYLDVEGLPDRDFYYLIGLRIGHGDSAVQHSLWADTVEDEGKIWREFLAILETVEKPVLIHYGSYETNFSKQMAERHGSPQAESIAAKAIALALNLVSVMFAKIYFPTFSNGLKEIAGRLGYQWTEYSPSGLRSICWRHEWEQTKAADLRERSIKYNADDCQALESVTMALMRLGTTNLDRQPDTKADHAVAHTELMPHQTLWPRFSSSLPEFEQANKAARWDYQRDRIYVRSSKRIRRIARLNRGARKKAANVNTRIIVPDDPICPKCGKTGWHQNVATKVLHDLFFSRWGLKKWVAEYRFRFYKCLKCHVRFGRPSVFWPGSKFGKNLFAYIAYEMVELNTPQGAIRRTLKRLFGYDFDGQQIHRFKVQAAAFYKETRQRVLDRIVDGTLVHADETRANVRGKTAYVWVFTNLHEVAYLYSDSREGEVAQVTLASFRGVLVSDFYSGYDLLACPQQKCLLHLMRDLNAEILRNPYDEELKRMVSGFAHLLKEIVETVDRFGLKRHFLHKHHRSVERFYRQITLAKPQSEAALRCQQRFERNRDKLFTFLDYDGVPWNNNNAEHAIKAFAALRDVMEGSSTEKGIDDYLILLTVCQTCKYMGVDFLDFLRSGEKDVHAFAESRTRRKPSPPGVTPVQS